MDGLAKFAYAYGDDGMKFDEEWMPLLLVVGVMGGIGGMFLKSDFTDAVAKITEYASLGIAGASLGRLVSTFVAPFADKKFGDISEKIQHEIDKLKSQNVIEQEETQEKTL